MESSTPEVKRILTDLKRKKESIKVAKIKDTTVGKLTAAIEAEMNKEKTIKAKIAQQKLAIQHLADDYLRKIQANDEHAKQLRDNIKNLFSSIKS